MKILWLSNMLPGTVRSAVSGKPGSGLWLDSVLRDLRQQGMRLHLMCRGGTARGALDENCSFALFPEEPPQRYSQKQEAFFQKELEAFQPDVIHIWGSEYSHTLAMVKACGKAGYLDRVVVSIQGLCGVYAAHYVEGVPLMVQRGITFRDIVKRDNLLHQQKVFALRGTLEAQALAQVNHVIGRTEWDLACTQNIAPKAQYHHCNETLRQEFYAGSWEYTRCQKHRIFASSCSYPIKGFHYLLKALAEVVRDYPDATLAVPGKSFLQLDTMEKKLRAGSYQTYLAQLARQYHLEDRIEFLGGLSADGMKEQYLKANVFALPSTIENSPNSLGEAMLLGTPCVAADVGGVSTMLAHNREGFVYQSTAPYMLAHYIKRVFAMQGEAARMGAAAAEHAGRTHDSERNMEQLLSIYRQIDT